MLTLYVTPSQQTIKQTNKLLLNVDVTPSLQTNKLLLTLEVPLSQQTAGPLLEAVGLLLPIPDGPRQGVLLSHLGRIVRGKVI